MPVAAYVHLDHAALALDRDHALFHLLEQLARLGKADHRKLGRRVIVGDDRDIPDAKDPVEEGLADFDHQTFCGIAGEFE